MAAYLIEHPPRVRQFRNRGVRPSGVVVVHTAESTPDWVNHDSGAENVAHFIATRTTYGSYHDLADSDSIVNLVPYWMQAYHDGTGSNPHSYGVSAATQAHKWNEAPREWRNDTVTNMARASARYARWLKRKYGIDIPARRISRDQSSNRVPGFISHGERDPGRRTDPGAEFPWGQFLDTYQAIMNGESVSEGDWFDMATEKELRRIVAEEVRQNVGISDIITDVREGKNKVERLNVVMRRLLNDERAIRNAVQANTDSIADRIIDAIPRPTTGEGLTAAQVRIAVEEGVRGVFAELGDGE